MFRSGSDTTIRGRVSGEVESVTENDIVEYYGCDLCSHGGWSSETEVEIHKASVHYEDITQLLTKEKYLCRMCISRFKCALDLLRHIKQEHLLSSEDAYRVEREIFICDYCSQIFFNKALLGIHIRHFHHRHFIKIHYGDVMPCPKCDKQIRVYSVWFHFQTHSMQSVSLCRICLSKCKNKRQLHQHLKTHSKLLKCEICSFETKRDDLFQKHVYTEHKNYISVDRGPIDFNKYFYPSLETLLSFSRFTGLKGLTLTNRVKICILCREICVGVDKMKNHILKEHNYKAKIVRGDYSCSCGESFTNKILLKQHIFKLKGDHKIIE